MPKPLFADPTSTVVKSSEEQLIGARIADDGQWRFPEVDSVPHRFKQCILYFEDEYFYRHPGFNPISIYNAIKHNVTKKSRRGGSTITQQLIRLSRKGKRRTYFEKLIELFLATRLEAGYSKEEILNLYASYTPYGGNVVGLETASWRYFGIPASKLSWGQAATLAVLPNAPSLIFPGRNEQRLLSKRNRLLEKLYSKEEIDQLTYELAIEEPLPSKPLPLPNIASHLTERIRKEHHGKAITTSVDFGLQQRANQIVKNHYYQLRQNEINNIAVLVLEVETRKVLAYVGNSPTDNASNKYVDVIGRNRSTGSILKPFLYAATLDAGNLLPNALVKDVPTIINGYAPENFDKTFQGAVPASVALSKSLNVPAVRMLRAYGQQKFYNRLKGMQLQSLNKSSSHYGLSLILGGAESSLWEVTATYASLAATLNYYNANSSTYQSNSFVKPSYQLHEVLDFGTEQFEPLELGAGAIFNMMTALKEVNRPEGEENWSFFNDAQPIAWKTGTSFGFKDAWAVGTTPKYTIGVWVGNADGEGRPGLTGIKAAAPILFDVLDALPPSGWFTTPYDDMVELAICEESGHLAGKLCKKVRKKWVPKKGIQTSPCNFHEQLFLDASERFQVNSDCYEIDQMRTKNWFVLPPVMAYYYEPNHPEYAPKPPFLEGCSNPFIPVMDFIYPTKNEEILLPATFEDEVGEVVFKLAHKNPDTKVFWYLDDRYLKETQTFHELAVSPDPGEYVLTVVDENGNRLEQQVVVRLASED